MHDREHPGFLEDGAVEGFDMLAIPEHLRTGLIAYALDCRRPGDFLLNLFRNDLFEAIARADDESLIAIKRIVLWVNTYTASSCHGSHAAVEAWLARAERMQS